MSPFDLNLRHLRGILAIRQSGSVSVAAEALGLSQPALTQGLFKLEGQLGQPLFERRPAGMTLTEQGERAAQRIQAALDHLGAATRRMQAARLQPERRLSASHLRALLALSETGSFAAAAGRIGLSQPSVHRGVRELEAALETRLVERRGRGVHVNLLGKRMTRACRLYALELEAAFFELGLDDQAARIAVGTTPLARALLVPEAMARTVQKEPLASFQVFEGSWGDLVELLRDGILDVIVGDMPDYESPDLRKRVIREEPVVVVSGRRHPLAAKRRIGLSELAAYPWIVAPDNSPLRASWQDLFASVKRPPAPIECGSIMIIGRMLTSTHQLTLATPDQVALQIRTGLLARIPYALSTRIAIGLTTRDGWRPTSLQASFLSTLVEAANKELAPEKVGSNMAQDWN